MFKKKSREAGEVNSSSSSSSVKKSPSSKTMKAGSAAADEEEQKPPARVTARVRFTPAQIETLENFIKAKDEKKRSESLTAALHYWMTRPRIIQREELEQIMERFPEPTIPVDHPWNDRFGEGSLFEAWTHTSVIKGMTRANALLIRELLDQRVYARNFEWRIVDMSSSSLWLVWQLALKKDDVGELVLVHPVEEVVSVIRRILPPGVKLRTIDRKQTGAVEIPDADIILCGMTLHHIAGRDSKERNTYGIGQGEGKLEALQSIGRALTARNGVGIVNEADSYTDIPLPPNHSVLVNNIMDSYVRRCAHSVLDDIEDQENSAGGDMRDRWKTITRVWCMNQVNAAALDRADRDIYELDVMRWLELLVQANLKVMEHSYTDVYGLFHRYVFTVRQ